MNIFITGGTGYIGSKLSKRLIGEGHNVAILKREASDLNNLSEFKDQITFYNYEGDFSSMNAAVEDFKPDLGIHLASLYVYSHSAEDIDALIDSNLRLGLHLTEALVKNGCKKLVNTGTSFEHFKNDDYNPVNLYAATKNAFSALLKYYTKSAQLSALTIKLFDTYGPDDNRGKLVSYLIGALSSGEEVQLSGGDQIVDYAHVDDVVNAYLKAIELLMNLDTGYYSEFGGVTGERVTLKQLVALIEEVSGKKLKVQFGAKPYRFREVMKPWSNFWELPDLPPKKSLKEGLKELIDEGN